MKKLIALIVCACALLNLSAQEVIISQWKGYGSGEIPSSPPVKPKNGTSANLENAVLTLAGANFGGQSAGSQTGTQSCSSTGWGGEDTEKYWVVTFSTLECKDMKVSSAQFGSGTGPGNFQIQYKDGDMWKNISGGQILISKASTWEATSSVSLPSSLENQQEVSLRWICTSSVSIAGGNVGNTGSNRIEITITGSGDNPGEVIQPTVAIAAWKNYVSSELNASDEFVIPKAGIEVNLTGAKLKVKGATFSGQAVGSTTDFQACNSRNWNAAGGETEKCWEINFCTSGYEKLTLISSQYSSGTGPKDFKIQYKNGEVWTDLSGGIISLPNAKWQATTELELPAILENSPFVTLRWLCTSTVSANDGAVTATGTNRMEIVVSGKAISANTSYKEVCQPEISCLSSEGYVSLNNIPDKSIIYIYDITGQLISSCKSECNHITLPVTKGRLYLVKVVFDSGTQTFKVKS